MPDIEPQKAANLLQSVATAVSNAVGRGENKTSPDILIDQNAGGEDAIQSVDISYITKDVETAGVDEIKVKKKVRVIKIDIKGNLYLPLEGYAVRPFLYLHISMSVYIIISANL